MEKKQVNILVVEDEPGMALLLTRLLEQLGYAVLPIEKTGEGAINSTEENNPDLILMDIYLEGEMTGIQAAEKILAANNIPVIYATSDSDENTIKTARSTYPLGYIVKPYNKNVLKSTIEVALSIREVDSRKNEELQLAYETISNQTHEILESFKSAKDIQYAILPSEKDFLKEHPNCFIFNKPKERLGGDFFWYKKLTKNRVLFAVVDCTGHGVPGALMSILVNYQLNKALAQLNDNDTLGTMLGIVDRVLSDTYEGTKNELDASQISNLNAGFDAAVCLWDPDHGKLTFCGAKRPLLLVRNNELKEIKGNRSSVGLFALTDKGYDSIDINIQEGDTIYVYSDGYADQIGDKSGRRLKSAPFRNLILKYSVNELAEQHRNLEDAFEVWKGGEEQMDDVLVLGMKF
ncbi:MAG: hypothetical protein CL840_12685 [Crocinitomicaceae bacterium]|nr:hypothetical protein [Crocinitomicaceae bacterium]